MKCDLFIHTSFIYQKVFYDLSASWTGTWSRCRELQSDRLHDWRTKVPANHDVELEEQLQLKLQVRSLFYVFI